MNDDQEQDIRGMRRRLEAEMFALEGEKKSLERKKDAVMVEVTRTKRDITHLEADLEQHQSAMTALDRSIFDAESSISQLKRKMNAL